MHIKKIFLLKIFVLKERSRNKSKFPSTNRNYHYLQYQQVLELNRRLIMVISISQQRIKLSSFSVQ